MKIVIIGDGKVGHKLTTQLSEEDYDIVLIDQNAGKLKEMLNEFDIFCITGNGADVEVQKQADVPHADLVIACASMDEMNMLCCLLARKLGAKHTIARVRNPIYYREIDLFKEDLRLSMTVNPELSAANEIARILLFSEASKVETFMKGKAEMIEHVLKKDSPLVDMSLAEIDRKFRIKILVCAVKRDNTVYIPSGNFVLRADDRLHIVAGHQDLRTFFRSIGRKSTKTKRVLICGGGDLSLYLSLQLLQAGMQVKIIERNEQRCEYLCDMLPKATIIQGDAADHDLLIEEGIQDTDALVALTNMDEENIIVSLFAKGQGVAKIVAKVNEDSRAQMVEGLGIDSIVSVKGAAADEIVNYVRARKNSYSNAEVETIYRLLGGKIEALEFIIKKECNFTNVPLKELGTKPNNLIACIGRGRKVIIPGGDDHLEAGDSVIVVTKEHIINKFTDILA